MSIWLTGCNATPEPNIKDGGLLSGEPCGPPCFFDLIPGFSSRKDMVNKLHQYQLDRNCIINPQYNDEDMYVVCNDFSIIFDGFKEESDLIQQIVTKPENTVIKTIIDKYGKPDYVNIIVWGTVERYTTANVIYIKEQLVIRLIELETRYEYIISDDALIKNFVYIDETTLTTLLQDPQTQLWYGNGIYKFSNK